MRPDTTSVPFVDLYELLDLPPHSDVATIRKRITTLYLDAQNNLDHRSYRKRFYYQELFETYLPQAHHLLLNETRRTVYDTQLHAHRARQEAGDPEASKHFVPAPPALGAEAAEAAHDTATATPVPAEVSAQMQSPQLVTENNPTAPARPTPRPPTPSWARMDPVQVERRRDIKRRMLIQRELVIVGLFWGAVYGMSVALLMGLLLYAIVEQLPGGPLQPLGLSRLVFNFICFLTMVTASVLCARLALRRARRHIVTLLSRMPYDQLLRRCQRG